MKFLKKIYQDINLLSYKDLVIFSKFSFFLLVIYSFFSIYNLLLGF